MITETCSCGANITVDHGGCDTSEEGVPGLWRPNRRAYEQRALADWRANHRHEPAAADTEPEPSWHYCERPNCAPCELNRFMDSATRQEMKDRIMELSELLDLCSGNPDSPPPAENPDNDPLADAPMSESPGHDCPLYVTGGKAKVYCHVKGEHDTHEFDDVFSESMQSYNLRLGDDSFLTTSIGNVEQADPPCPFPMGAKVRRATGFRPDDIGEVDGWSYIGYLGSWRVWVQWSPDWGRTHIMPDGLELVPDSPAASTAAKAVFGAFADWESPEDAVYDSGEWSD